MSLRRYYHRQVKHHQRFHVAVFLTILAVAWVAVPAVTSFVETVGRYVPRVYEPKDTERGLWLEQRGTPFIQSLTWENILKVALFIFAALAWLAVAPSIQRPGRPTRR